MSKNLIIIPGSCSTSTSWYDQIFYFSNLDYKVSFIDLPCSEKNIDKAAEKLFKKINRYHTKLLSRAKSKSETIFLCHSMGGMQILNILLNKEYFSTLDPDTFNFIVNSQIFFSQVPLRSSMIILKLLRLTAAIYHFPMAFHSNISFKYCDRLLLNLKQKSSNKDLTGRILKIFDIVGVFNHLSILNDFLGTSPEDFSRLIDYYENWDLITDKNKNITKILKENFKKNITKKYSFGTGYPDAFCSYKDSQKLANCINANIENFPWCFHLPMHMPWTQKAFNNWVLSTTK